MIKDIPTSRLSKFKSSLKPNMAFVTILLLVLFFWVRAEINANREKQRIGEDNRALVEQAQQEAKTRRRAETRAFIEALKKCGGAPPSAQTRANTYYCAELCPGRGRIHGDPVTAIWEHNGLNTDPNAPHLWTPTNFVATLLAPTHATNAPFAWPQNATVLLADYGALIAFEHILPFHFPYAGGLCNRIAISTSGLIFFDCVAYPRGNSWPLATPFHGDALSALAVYYGDLQLLEGSTIETFTTNKNGVQGQAFRWKDMARFDNDAGTNRVTFGAVLWENGDVELFHEGDLAEIPGITGVQHHAAHWDMPSVTNGVLTISRLLDADEAAQLTADGLNRITKFLWHLDENKISFADDGVADSFKLAHRLCPHEPIAHLTLVNGGLTILEAYQNDCDPWQTASGGGVPFDTAIAAGLDPNSNWQPENASYGCEGVTFLLKAGEQDEIFTFSGLSGDPRTQRWVVQSNAQMQVTVKLWVGAKNVLRSGGDGAVELVDGNYSMGFSLGGIVAPGSAPSPQQKQGYMPLAFIPLSKESDCSETCYECWKKKNVGVPSKAREFYMRRCFPHPPSEPNGFWVSAPDYWCLDTHPGGWLWYYDKYLGATLIYLPEVSKQYVPCGCEVVLHYGTTLEGNYRTYAKNDCECVKTSEVITKNIIPNVTVGVTRKVAPDLHYTLTEGLATNLTVTLTASNYHVEMANHFGYEVQAVRRFINDDGKESDELIHELKFANGQTKQPLNSASIELTWDGILTDYILKRRNGVETFAGMNQLGQESKMRRQLPAANAGETVPYPFFDVKVTVWHKCAMTGNVAVKRDPIYHRVWVPQIIYVKWHGNAGTIFTQDYLTRDGFVAIDKTGALQSVAINQIIGYMRDKTEGAHIEFINGYAHPNILRPAAQNVKTVNLANVLPRVNNNDVYGYADANYYNFGNGRRDGQGFVHMDYMQRRLRTDFSPKRQINSAHPPYTHSDLITMLSVTALHETCHLFGLVSTEYLYGRNEGGYITHNRDTDETTPYVMNHGDYITFAHRIDNSWPINFKELNKKYLLFILPSPPPQGN